MGIPPLTIATKGYRMILTVFAISAAAVGAMAIFYVEVVMLQAKSNDLNDPDVRTRMF